MALLAHRTRVNSRINGKRELNGEYKHEECCILKFEIIVFSPSPSSLRPETYAAQQRPQFFCRAAAAEKRDDDDRDADANEREANLTNGRRFCCLKRKLKNVEPLAATYEIHESVVFGAESTFCFKCNRQTFERVTIKHKPRAQNYARDAANLNRNTTPRYKIYLMILFVVGKKLARLG